MGKGGRWFEGPRPETNVWIHAREGHPLHNEPMGRCAPIGAYLEIRQQEGGTTLEIGDTVLVEVAAMRKEFELVSIRNRLATVRRPVCMPPEWRGVKDNESDSIYYHNIRTNDVQWEFPDLPHHWQALTDHPSGGVYYHT